MIIPMRSGLAGCLVLLAAAGPAVGQEIRPTPDKIKETGVLQLGYRETSRPFSFRGSDGQPAGFSVDLCQQVATALRHSLKLPGLKVAWVAVTPADRIVQLVRGAIDLECGSTTITFGRMEQVAFSHMISVDGGSLLATAASGIGSVKDLAGKRVGVILNTTTEKALAAALARASIQAAVIPVTEIGAGLQGLEEGRLDAYAADRILLASLLTTAKNPAQLRLSDEWRRLHRGVDRLPGLLGVRAHAGRGAGEPRRAGRARPRGPSSPAAAAVLARPASGSAGPVRARGRPRARLLTASRSGEGHPQHLPERRADRMEAQRPSVRKLGLVLGFLRADDQLTAVAVTSAPVSGPRRDGLDIGQDAVPELVADALRGEVHERVAPFGPCPGEKAAGVYHGRSVDCVARGRVVDHRGKPRGAHLTRYSPGVMSSA